MADKNLVVISELGNPTNSFIFHADFEKLSYNISINHTNIDTIKANEVYTHIRNRNTTIDASLIFFETAERTVNDCVSFFENMTYVGDEPYKAVSLYYDGNEIINKNFLITEVSFEFMDYLLYEVGQPAKPRRANVEVKFQVFQSNYAINMDNPTNIGNGSNLKFF